MMRFCLIITCCLVAQQLSAQFSDSVFNHILISSNNSINKADAGNAYLFNNRVRYAVQHKTIRLNFNNNWLYGSQSERVTNNDFSSSLDFNLFKTFPNFYYWGLVNYNTSYSLRIRNQLLSGAGIAYNFFDSDVAYLNLSNGLLYDASSIYVDDERVDYQTLRNSLRLSFNFIIANLITISGTNFYQPSLNDGTDYNIRLNNSLGFRLNQWLSLTSNLTYNRVNRTNRENVLFTYGLTFQHYF